MQDFKIGDIVHDIEMKYSRYVIMEIHEDHMIVAERPIKGMRFTIKYKPEEYKFLIKRKE